MLWISSRSLQGVFQGFQGISNRRHTQSDVQEAGTGFLVNLDGLRKTDAMPHQHKDTEKCLL